MGGLSKGGYGRFWIDGKTEYAHRIAYRLANGPIPPEMQVCHSCDERYPVDDQSYRACCNPGHLWLGTPAENVADMVAKGRSLIGNRSWSRRQPEKVRSGERHAGHKLTTEQVRAIRALSDASAMTQVHIAEIFGITQGTVGRIVRREGWRKIT